LPEPEPEKDFEVWQENWDVVSLFLRCQTQWRTSVGGITGLDYASVVSIAKLYKYKDLPSVIEDLQIMEIAAMAEMNKEKK
tara:strand:- start:2356 stop:2598 length:243 start_codon:yes stop_codon:yes gene_type:complete